MDNRTADHGSASESGESPTDALSPGVAPILPPQSNAATPTFGFHLIFQWARRNRFLKATVALIVLIVGAWLLGRHLYAWHHLDAGKRDLARDHCASALEHFQAALTIWPDDAATQVLAARAARR